MNNRHFHTFFYIIHSNTVNNLPLSTNWLLTYNFNLYQQLCLQILFQPGPKRLSFNFSFANNRFYSFIYLSDWNTLCIQTDWSIVCVWVGIVSYIGEQILYLYVANTQYLSWILYMFSAFYPTHGYFYQSFRWADAQNEFLSLSILFVTKAAAILFSCSP